MKPPAAVQRDPDFRGDFKLPPIRGVPSPFRDAEDGGQHRATDGESRGESAIRGVPLSCPESVYLRLQLADLG